MTAQAADIGRPPFRAGAAALPAFLLLYETLYTAYGTESAYLPSFLQNHGLPIEIIGTVLSAGTVVRIIAGPAVGRLADRLQSRRAVLCVAAAMSAAIGLAYLLAFGVWPLLAVIMVHSAATAPLAPLADALAVAASTAPGGFQYGWVRGTGSAAFVAGTLLSGQLVDRLGLFTIIVASSSLFAAMKFATARVQAPRERGADPSEAPGGGFRAVLATPAYRRLLMIAALVIGSHAMNDAFAVIIWRGAGYDGTAISLFWSESVLAEVLVFFVIGPMIIARIGPAGALMVAAGSGVVRWSVMGATTAWPALVAVQALHGFTFALLHLAAMGIIGSSVPSRLSATAQSIYGNLALGMASAVLTFASGYLYAGLGLHAFWVMAALCCPAVLLAVGLRGP